MLIPFVIRGPWCSALGAEQIAALLQESLRSGTIESKDPERVGVDTAVQENADARFTYRAIEKLLDLPNAKVSECAGTIGGWPSAAPSWTGAIRTRVSSSAPGGN